MPLSAGTRLGPYEILAAIGAGGMGEVYRARDTKLDRNVAIKILPESFANDPERIAQGALPIDEALQVAKQIAEALEAAHEKGITHRDLKPANVKLRPDGTVKVLDFGLATVAQSTTAYGSNATISPTLTLDYAATRVGMIMGTAAYMSPEQAAGQAVDRRADIWAFGVVLYELLTGERLFTGETVAHVLAAVLNNEPDFRKIPAGVRPLLRKCLQKKPKERLQAIGDWELLLSQESNEAADASSASSPWKARVGERP